MGCGTHVGKKGNETGFDPVRPDTASHLNRADEQRTETIGGGSGHFLGSGPLPALPRCTRGASSRNREHSGQLAIDWLVDRVPNLQSCSHRCQCARSETRVGCIIRCRIGLVPTHSGGIHRPQLRLARVRPSRSRRIGARRPASVVSTHDFDA